jgi:hypothetical protein
MQRESCADRHEQTEGCNLARDLTRLSFSHTFVSRVASSSPRSRARNVVGKWTVRTKHLAVHWTGGERSRAWDDPMLASPLRPLATMAMSIAMLRGE